MTPYPLTVTIDTTPWLPGDIAPSLDVEWAFFTHLREQFWKLDPTLDKAYMSAILISTAHKHKQALGDPAGQNIDFTIPLHQDDAEVMYAELPASFRLGLLVAKYY